MKGWSARTVQVAEDGTMRLEHIRPDGYTLRLAGPHITPRRFAFDVPRQGLELGPLRLDGRGRIEGRVFRSAEHGGGPWAFADGRVRSPAFEIEEGVNFMSDEDGNFAADDVPVGLVRVGFPYAVFDVIHADEWVAQVLEGQTTHVRLIDPERSRPLPVTFRIGDGSREQYQSGTGLGATRKVDNVTIQSALLPGERGGGPRMPMFWVGLGPRSRDPLAFVDTDWEEPDAQGRVVLSDVGPGAY